MKLILTSSVSEVAHDIIRHIDLKKGNKLVFISTAAEINDDDDLTWLDNDRNALIKAGFDVTDYTITGKTISELRSFLPKFDFIYLSGGDTPYLLSQSYESGFITYVKELLENGKTYIGTSAGSIVTGPYVPNYLFDSSHAKLNVKGKSAYGLVNFTIAAHWGSKDFKERYLNKRLKVAYNLNSYPFVLLTDKQYICVENNQLEIVDLEHKK